VTERQSGYHADAGHGHQPTGCFIGSRKDRYSPVELFLFAANVLVDRKQRVDGTSEGMSIAD
jgi:hypothetical protein